MEVPGRHVCALTEKDILVLNDVKRGLGYIEEIRMMCVVSIVESLSSIFS